MIRRLRRTLRRASEAFATTLSGRRVRAFVERLGRRFGITPVGVTAVLLAVLLWVVARVVAGRSMYLFSYGSLLLIVATLVGGRRKLPLEGSRSETRPRAKVGEVLPIEITLRSRRRLSNVVLEEQLPERLGEPVRLPIATLHSGEEIKHTYRLHCRRRGAYRLGPLVARWGDPVGLSQKEMELAPAFELLVHPRVEPASDRPLTRVWEDPPIRPPVSKPWPSGFEFYGMRNYAPGDDPRRIVWKAYAKTGKLLVRESEQGITDRITIVLDTDAHFHTREDPSESFEEGVSIAASLGYRHLHEGYTVTVDVNDGPLARALRGVRSQNALLDALARVEMSRTPLSRAILRIVAENRRGEHTIIVTPRLLSRDAALMRKLLARGGSVMVVALVWEPEAEETLATAASLGCQVTEIRPGQSIAMALSRDVGAGRR